MSIKANCLFFLLIFTAFDLIGQSDKFKFPTNDMSGKIQYSREIYIDSASKEKIYDHLIKWAYSNYQAKEIKSENKADGIISLLGRTKYFLDQKENILGYKLALLINDNSCTIVITDLNIRHTNIEVNYNEYLKSKRKLEKYTELYESIDTSIWDLIGKIEIICREVE